LVRSRAGSLDGPVVDERAGVAHDLEAVAAAATGGNDAMVHQCRAIPERACAGRVLSGGGDAAGRDLDLVVVALHLDTVAKRTGGRDDAAIDPDEMVIAGGIHALGTEAAVTGTVDAAHAPGPPRRLDGALDPDPWCGAVDLPPVGVDARGGDGAARRDLVPPHDRVRPVDADAVAVLPAGRDGAAMRDHDPAARGIDAVGA